MEGSSTRGAKLSRLQTGLNIGSAIAMIVAAGAMAWSATRPISQAEPPKNVVPKDPVSIDGAALRGDPEARLVMIEFADFECPACAKFATATLPDIVKRYVDTGQLLFAFRHLPLSIHPNAKPAAEMAQCAQAQGRFWDAYHALFRQTSLAAVDLGDLGVSAGLDRKALDACLSSASNGVVERDLREARAMGLRSTPTFMFGERNAAGLVEVVASVSGTGAPASFYRVIDSFLK